MPGDDGKLNEKTIFNGDNYDLWADAIKNWIDAKNKLGFIIGEVKNPEGEDGADNLEFVAWRQCNAMLTAWSRNVIGPKLHPSITFSLPLAKVWEELKSRFSAGNALRVHQLKRELNDCKQGRQSVV
ncbi:uncharacterized protein LOC141630128 [Silene latifolia]|uniref:uncharacterized protein LOC141630128 n=1 Tax=Silene latifolia TaxID=37657 RepID=UPI003D77AB32